MRLIILSGQCLLERPELAAQMFRDRKTEFVDRKGWALNVDAEGQERDEYDDLNPIYIIATDENGEHLGSTRLLPTTGRTMIADHFSHLTHGVEIASPTIWECTRFLVTDRGDRKVAPAIMWAGQVLAQRANVEFFVGVAVENLVRTYKAIGWEPIVIGREDLAEGSICACLWECSEDSSNRLYSRGGLEGFPLDFKAIGGRPEAMGSPT